MKNKQQVHEEVENYKRIELAKLRLEGKQNLQQQLSLQSSLYEQRVLDLEQKHADKIAQESFRFEQRLRDIESQNSGIREKLYEESNKIIFKEQCERNQYQLALKDHQMQLDLLQKRNMDLQAKLEEASRLKAEFMEKMQSQLAQYKIDLDKDYSNRLIQVEVERTKLDGDKQMLHERNMYAEKLMAQAANIESKSTQQLEKIHQLEKEIQHLSKELDSQILKNKEQSLLIHTQNTSNNLEFELASLKRQLLESEQTAERRQTDYQDLLKSLLPEQKSSSYWQKECQDLVMKLDYEVILDLCSSTGVMIYKTC